jgi:hypothetical protein
MDTVLTHRGRVVTAADLGLVRDLIATHPGASRRTLSKKLCEAWGWVQRNGALRDMVCRGLMLELHRAGHITLPPVRFVPPNPLTRRAKPSGVAIDRSVLRGTLRDLGPLDFRQVRRCDAEEALFNGLIATYHYLGYTQPVGAHLKYLVYARGRPVAALAFSSAPRHLGPRDRFIGWGKETRRQNIHLVAYNTRFLILPWVEVRHLASHILGRMARMLAGEWERMYGHPVYFVETFVDRARFRGTSYLAANWIWLGRTTGRGKADHTRRPNRPRKDVLGYGLRTDFRERLMRVG